ncbi:COMM domain-containing protein 6 isoform X1 [Clupea harengus]|uniref:COMM domain-containing protein 6 n=1 Tax=Clupea harengus TaxID=7950 RepID=A0A6P3W4Y3_CLUHA|nr:COMM domain-containing protein 6 isoform X1 [Clupea harengus]
MPGLESTSGVDSTVENIGRLPPDVFAETCQQILAHLQGQSSAVDLPKICVTFQRAGIDLEWKALQSIIRLLSSNFRTAAKNNLTADQLVARLGEGSRHWAKAVLQVVHQLWSEHGSLIHTYQEAHAMASIGQMVDMQWKLGMAVSSDTCRSLNSPYVSLLLKVADTSGEVSYKSFEMTIPQFQNFHSQFKDISAALETV